MDLQSCSEKLSEYIDVAAFCPHCERFSPEFENGYFKRGAKNFLKGPSKIMSALGSSLMVALAGGGLIYFISHQVTKIVGIGLVCLSPLVFLAKWNDKKSLVKEIDSYSDEVIQKILIQEYRIYSRQLYIVDVKAKHLHRKKPFCNGWQKRRSKKK